MTLILPNQQMPKKESPLELLNSLDRDPDSCHVGLAVGFIDPTQVARIFIGWFKGIDKEKQLVLLRSYWPIQLDGNEHTIDLQRITWCKIIISVSNR